MRESGLASEERCSVAKTLLCRPTDEIKRHACVLVVYNLHGRRGELAVSIVVVKECWFGRVLSKQDMDRRCRAQVAVNSVRCLVV